MGGLSICWVHRRMSTGDTGESPGSSPLAQQEEHCHNNQDVVGLNPRELIKIVTVLSTVSQFR